MLSLVLCIRTVCQAPCTWLYGLTPTLCLSLCLSVCLSVPVPCTSSLSLSPSLPLTPSPSICLIQSSGSGPGSPGPERTVLPWSDESGRKRIQQAYPRHLKVSSPPLLQSLSISLLKPGPLPNSKVKVFTTWISWDKPKEREERCEEDR